MGYVADNVFLITGASSGIGAATARLAASQGDRLVLAARRLESLEALAEELGGPERVLAVRCDVGDPEQVTAMVERIVSRWGRLDVAYANAGQFRHSQILGEADAYAEWRDMVLTNVYGAAITAHAVWPLLTASRGHLIFTGSVAGRVTVAGSLYSATKWAVTGLAQAIRVKAIDTGVRVSVIQPGLVDAGPSPQERRDDPKLSPEDVARTVMFAVSAPPGVDINEILVRPLGQRR